MTCETRAVSSTSVMIHDRSIFHKAKNILFLISIHEALEKIWKSIDMLKHFWVFAILVSFKTLFKDSFISGGNASDDCDCLFEQLFSLRLFKFDRCGFRTSIIFVVTFWNGIVRYNRIDELQTRIIEFLNCGCLSVEISPIFFFFFYCQFLKLNRCRP